MNKNYGYDYGVYDTARFDEPFLEVRTMDRFARNQSSWLRKPSYSVMAEVQGDISDYVLSIDVASEIENSLHEPLYGFGSIVISNKGGQFTDADGKPLFVNGYKVKVWAGFDGDNTPIWTGVVTDAIADSASRQVTLSVAQPGELLAKARTSGDYSDYDSPKLLINELCNRVGLVSPEYENEAGAPTTYTFGSTHIRTTRSYLSLVHGACLCIFYVPYFDHNGVLQIHRRNTYNDMDFTFDDSNLKMLRYRKDAELINHKILDYGTGLKFGFPFGDNLHPYQQIYSESKSASSARWGEDADYETDELIGTYDNAKALIPEILDYYAYKRTMYEAVSRAVPQLDLFDRVSIYSEKNDVEGKFGVVGINHSISPGRYTTTHTLLSMPERF